MAAGALGKAPEPLEGKVELLCNWRHGRGGQCGVAFTSRRVVHFVRA